MQNYPLPPESGTLDLLAQPVLHVAEERIIFRNSAAALLLPDQLEVQGLLDEENLEAYRAHDGRSLLSLTLRLGGRPFHAAVRREAGRDVFVAQAQPRFETLRPDTLTILAQNVRRELAELFDAAHVLLPAVEELEKPRLQRQTARMNKSLYTLLRLSANLSDVGRCMAGESCLRLEGVELAGFLDGLCAGAAPLCAQMGVELVYRRPQAVLVTADPQYLERAVLNLLSNALRFTPRGGQISVSLEAGPARVYLRIHDSGEGIAPAEMAGIFNRYERGAAAPGDPRGRAGLGLPLAQLVSQLHGGTVVVSSGPEGGTTVTMSVARRLPAGDAEGFCSPIRRMDYAGGYDHALLELSDALPLELFDSVDIN
ncbi:MAG: sensor histidine kinase [Oscillospiraceae bacterium]|nr:sensor histidine kinase [Oscillospiraceae bacterium]